jgi:flagellar protein FlaF
MQQAARLNWRLWTIIQADVLSPECPLPDDLRANILSLAHFIDKRTVDFIGDQDPAKLDILVNINRELAGGLRARPAEGVAEREMPPPRRAAAAAGGGPSSTDTSA